MPAPSTPLSDNLFQPFRHCKPPVSSHQCSRQNIDDFDAEYKEAIPALHNVEQHRLNVVLEEDPRDGSLRNFLGLLGDCVLVCKYRRRTGFARVSDGVGGRDDGHEVLEFMEMRGGGVDCPVQGVDERRQERAEGELADYVGEVEC
jgi:hypothetical protein